MRVGGGSGDPPYHGRVSLRLYDTATRSPREFVPLVPGQASIYLCGLTVQGPPHIGHVRNWVTIDILRRWLSPAATQVTLVRNVTDIDDKILLKAASDRVRGGRWPTATSARSARPSAHSAASRRPTSRARPGTSPR